MKEIVDVKYRSGRVSVNTVKKGIIKNKKVLTELDIGYEPAWKGNLDLEMDPNVLQLLGYLDVDNTIITSFSLYSSKEKITIGKHTVDIPRGLPFTIIVYKKSKKAVIHGENHVYVSEFERIKDDFRRFSEASGINIKLEKSSEIYHGD